MKKITVILSGVGIYGYSGLALMEFFYRNQIKPNLIIGCSQGALTAALWAKGYSPQEALEKIKIVYQTAQKAKIDMKIAFSFFKKIFGKYNKTYALLKTEELKKIYEELFLMQRIEHLPVETIFQSTNAEDGETHYIRQGLLSEAVYASSAILPFYPPLKMENKWLVDGVFSESLPLKIVLEEQSDLIIVMDPQMPTVSDERNFMFYYAQFVQKALKKSSAPRTALAYDLESSEIIVLPVKMRQKWREDSTDSLLKQLLDASRKAVSDKEALIFNSLRREG